jgi:hypothetical protein
VCETDPPNQPIEVRQSLDAFGESLQAYPKEIKIRNRLVTVDEIIHGPVCSDNWSGTVYVDCDVQVADWQDTPNFFDGCDLKIEDGTTVYVAYHNDEAYYQGCSCHYSSE